MNEDLVQLSLFNISYFLNSPLVRPKTLQLSLTSRCNLRCKMCTVNKYTTGLHEEMSLEEIFRIIDVAKNQFNIKYLILTGGEPLLLGEKVIKIFEYASQLDIGVVLTTNGFFLEEYARELTKFKAVHFHVSVDGLRETHNAIRGNPQSFDKAIAGLKLLIDLRSKHGFTYTTALATLILKNNIDELFALYSFADELGVDVFDLLPYVPDNTDFSLTEQTSLWPDAQDTQRFIQVFKRIAAAETKQIGLNKEFDIDLTVSYYQRKLHLADWRCFAGFKTLFITMSDPKLQGAFEPCLFLCKAHFPLREYDYNLEKIWYSQEAHNARVAIKNCDASCYQMCFSLPSAKKIFTKTS